MADSHACVAAEAFLGLVRRGRSSSTTIGGVLAVANVMRRAAMKKFCEKDQKVAFRSTSRLIDELRHSSASSVNSSALQNLAFANDVLLTEHDLAHRQKRSVKTIRNQRLSGAGVKFLKLGRLVRYRLADAIEWENAGLRASTSDEGSQDA